MQNSGKTEKREATNFLATLSPNIGSQPFSFLGLDSRKMDFSWSIAKMLWAKGLENIWNIGDQIVVG